MSGATGKICPHCQAPLLRLVLNEIVCDHPFDLVCFNDDCPYYARGWAWMEQQYGVRASYRYRVDLASGHATPVPVWSPDALRNCVLPDEPGDLPAAQEHP